MKIFLAGLCAIVFGAFLVTVSASPTRGGQHLLGAQQCTWGPTYWCSNLTNAKGCNAVRHCIQTVWEKKEVPVDTDSVCKICKDMVTQARDQLRSNETEEELKEVFEGSCRLIPIKPVADECCKVADNFIPELVETLSSEMNPDQVCSVAGLCNSAHIDQLLFDYYRLALEDPVTEGVAAVVTATTEKPKPKNADKKALSCNGCTSVANVIATKFHSSSRDDILDNILHVCGQMSSFSDACGNIVLTYFNEIYDHLSKNLHADAICHMSGVCAGKFHVHKEPNKEGIEIQTKSDVGFVPVKGDGGDDIPCELCEQLVQHLRDVLVANTTEIEFKQILDGFCGQTQQFKDECLSIVDQYYDVIYHNLVNNLNANGACFMIGVCPKGLESSSPSSIDDLLPLLPVLPPAKINVTIRKKVLGVDEPVFSEKQIASMQLPIDKLMGASNPELLVENGQLCTVCEYFLHFVQEALSTPANEDEIKSVVGKTCEKFPKTIKNECHNFVDTYSDAVIALLIQGLNPNEICPKMAMCPAGSSSADIEVFAPKPIDVSIHSNSADDLSDKPTCSFCVFAVMQAQQMIKQDKSKRNIRNVLSHLCSPLPHKLKGECEDFVQTYSNELLDKLISDFTPQEICVDIQLCPPTAPSLDEWDIKIDYNLKNDISSVEETSNEILNELPVETYFQPHDTSSSPNCVLCEEVIRLAEKKIVDKKSKEEIKRALEHSCDKLKKNLQGKCHKYVDKYGDEIADLVMKQMSPKMICREIGLCLWTEPEDLEVDEALKYDVIAMPNAASLAGRPEKLTGVGANNMVVDAPQCLLCEFVMAKLESELKDKTTQDDIKNTVENICKVMPKTVAASCNKFIDQYSNMIISLIDSVPPKEMCKQIQLCIVKLDSMVNDEVVECGVCHGATISLTSFFAAHKDETIDKYRMIAAGCGDLPAKYYDACSEMVSIYGQSIMRLVTNPDIDQSHVCAQIGKCFENEKPGMAYSKISGRQRRSEPLGANPCTYGPSYWCKNKENSKTCGTTSFCEEKIWKKKTSN